MIDIRDYPGVLDTLNLVLNSGKEATLKVETSDSGDVIGVAEHTRFWCGQFEAGATDRKKYRGTR